VTSTGCTPAPEVTTGAEWASAAEAYAAALNDAYRVGITDAMPFYAQDAHVDKRFIHYEGIGRPGFAQALRDNAQNPPTWTGGRDNSDQIDLVPTEPLYLSRDRFLEPLRRIDPAIVPAIDAAFLYTVGAAGIADETVLVSGASGIWTSQGASTEQVEDLAAGYLRGWTSGDSRAVPGQYTAHATLTDSLADREVIGASAIAAEAGGTSGLSLRGATPRSIPGGAEQAAFIDGDYGTGIGGADRLVLLLDMPGEGECPGAVAVVLWLDDDQRITREERLHRIDSVRRCTAPDERPSGWWDAVALPTAPAVTRTGTLHPGADDIAVWNGDPRIDPVIDWARQRFAKLGLPPPEPTSVTFLPLVDGDRWEAYGFPTGSDAPDLGLPFTADEACPDVPCRLPIEVRAATLHEFAHLYLAPSVYGGNNSYDVPQGHKRVEQFLATHVLTWHDPALPWGQRGNERAAETIAWGLMDQPYPVDPRLGPLACAELTSDFQTLTTTTPDPRACAEVRGAEVTTP
jgi:hypothetical protein